MAAHQHQRRGLLRPGAGLGAEAARGHLCVLRLDRLGYIVGGELVADELVRIDPHPQRPLGREQRGAADAGNAPDLAQHVADHEVAEADLVEAAVGRLQRDDLQHRARGFLDQDALLDHRTRQAGFHPFDPVLHLDRRHARIGAGHEIGDDLDLAERVAGRFEIQDAAGAVELLFDQPRGAVVEILRRGAGIAGADRDRRRRNDRILRDRQERDRQHTAEADEQGDHDRKDRAADEEGGHGSVSSAGQSKAISGLATPGARRPWTRCLQRPRRACAATPPGRPRRRP